MTKEDFLRVYGQYGELAKTLNQVMPDDCLEKHPCLDRLVESSGWLRNHWELSTSSPIISKIVIKDKVKENGNEKASD